MAVIGIDPGASGAIALIGDDVHVHDMPRDRGALRIMLGMMCKRADVVYLERQWARPGQCAGAMGSMMQAYGYMEAVLDSTGIKVVPVLPAAWKKLVWPDRKFPEGMSVQQKTKQQKEDSLVLARILFPSVDLSLKKHNGRAEALLIGYYGQRLAT